MWAKYRQIQGSTSGGVFRNILNCPFLGQFWGELIAPPLVLAKIKGCPEQLPGTSEGTLIAKASKTKDRIQVRTVIGVESA